MKAIEILKRELIGSFISTYSVGDWWGFSFGGCWLVCQNVIFKEEEFLTQLILDNYEPSKGIIDKGFLGKGVAVIANLRKTITVINLDEKCNLSIEFENGNSMLLPSNEDIVDWQWCINKSGQDPYHDYIIACFLQGEVEIK